MDEIIENTDVIEKVLTFEDILYSIKNIMLDHSLTADQSM